MKVWGFHCPHCEMYCGFSRWWIKAAWIAFRSRRAAAREGLRGCPNGVDTCRLEKFDADDHA